MAIGPVQADTSSVCFVVAECYAWRYATGEMVYKIGSLRLDVKLGGILPHFSAQSFQCVELVFLCTEPAQSCNGLSR